MNENKPAVFAPELQRIKILIGRERERPTLTTNNYSSMVMARGLFVRPSIETTRGRSQQDIWRLLDDSSEGAPGHGDRSLGIFSSGGEVFRRRSGAQAGRSSHAAPIDAAFRM